VDSQLRTQLRVLARKVRCRPFSPYRAGELDHDLFKSLRLKFVILLKSFYDRLQSGKAGLQSFVGVLRIARLLLHLGQTYAENQQDQEEHENQRLG
jgi:hypothetical protein